MAHSTAIVFAGGDGALPDPERIPPVGLVIAADSGFDTARAAGHAVDLLVGDMDSVSATGLGEARSAGTEIQQHPVDKDATDLELALRAALRRGAESIVVLGGGGGRFDHSIGNALLLSAPFLDGTDIRWEREHETVMRALAGQPVTLNGRAGDLVSLLPASGTVTGVTTEGLRWRLDDAVLEMGTSRGMSNEMTGAGASVAVAAGVVLIVHDRRRRT